MTIYDGYIGYGYVLRPAEFDKYFPEEEDDINPLWKYFVGFDTYNNSATYLYEEDDDYGFLGVVLASASTDNYWCNEIDLSTIMGEDFKKEWQECLELLNEKCPDVVSRKPKTYIFVKEVG
jgi:hypothetical protein